MLPVFSLGLLLVSLLITKAAALAFGWVSPIWLGFSN